MPVGVRINFRPKVEQAGEFRRLVKNHVETVQASGQKMNLTERIWSPGGPSFSTVQMAETIGELYEAREEAQSRPQFSLNMLALSEILAAPMDVTLVDILNGGGADGNSPNFWIRVRLRPALGTGGALRQMLGDHASNRITAGERTIFSEDFWSEHGAAFTYQVGFASVDEAMDHRKQTAQDSEYQQFVQKLAPTLAGPAAWSVQRVLIPMNN